MPLRFGTAVESLFMHMKPSQNMSFENQSDLSSHSPSSSQEKWDPWAVATAGFVVGFALGNGKSDQLINTVRGVSQNLGSLFFSALVETFRRDPENLIPLRSSGTSSRD